MNSEDINTNINNFQEPNNLGQVNNVSTPMIGNNQNYQQHFRLHHIIYHQNTRKH